MGSQDGEVFKLYFLNLEDDDEDMRRKHELGARTCCQKKPSPKILPHSPPASNVKTSRAFESLTKNHQKVSEPATTSTSLESLHCGFGHHGIVLPCFLSGRQWL